MNDLIKAGLAEKYRNATRRLVLLDYDGTLVNYTPVPDSARLPDNLIDILIKLIGTPLTEVFIVTGRGYQDIDKILNHLQVNIIAEHGAMIKESGIWMNQINNTTLWKETMIPILKQITLKCPGSFVEEKTYSLTWHYRNADSQSGHTNSRELIRILEKIIHLYNLKILDGKKVVEIMCREVGKGIAVRKLFEQKHYDFVLSVGDDATDEEMFEYLVQNTNAFTIKVGEGDTFARYKLDSINHVLLLLKDLTV